MSSHRYQLLIADDDPGFRESLRFVFEPYFDLREADSGEEAVSIVAAHAVDLVLLDMHMRALSGVDTVRAVKTIRALVPCILITAHPTADVCRDAAAARAYTVLQKPVPKRELLSTVSLALQTTYNDPDPLHARWN